MSEVGFEALRVEHLPQLRDWLSAPHVSQWWGEPPTLEQVNEQYMPLITGQEPTRCYVIALDGASIGMAQTYLWADFASEAGAIGAGPGDAGLDYLIGETNLVGHGIGPLVIDRFLDEIVWAEPRVQAVVTSISVANRRSWRCLEKLGFQRSEERPVPGEPGPQYVLSLVRAQRSAAGQTSR
jgi:aminoglycoside 6'-N-acetyltransferase